MIATVKNDGTIVADGRVLRHMVGHVMRPGTRVTVTCASHLGLVCIIQDVDGNTGRYAPRV